MSMVALKRHACNFAISRTLSAADDVCLDFRASNRLLLRRWRSDISAARRPSTLIHFYGPAVCSQAAEAAANEPHIFIGLQPPAAAVNKPELLA